MLDEFDVAKLGFDILIKECEAIAPLISEAHYRCSDFRYQDDGFNAEDLAWFLLPYINKDDFKPVTPELNIWLKCSRKEVVDIDIGKLSKPEWLLERLSRLDVHMPFQELLVQIKKQGKLTQDLLNRCFESVCLVDGDYLFLNFLTREGAVPTEKALNNMVARGNLANLVEILNWSEAICTIKNASIFVDNLVDHDMEVTVEYISPRMPFLYSCIINSDRKLEETRYILEICLVKSSDLKLAFRQALRLKKYEYVDYLMKRLGYPNICLVEIIRVGDLEALNRYRKHFTVTQDDIGDLFSAAVTNGSRRLIQYVQSIAADASLSLNYAFNLDLLIEHTGMEDLVVDFIYTAELEMTNDLLLKLCSHGYFQMGWPDDFFIASDQSHLNAMYLAGIKYEDPVLIYHLRKFTIRQSITDILITAIQYKRNELARYLISKHFKYGNTTALLVSAITYGNDLLFNEILMTSQPSLEAALIYAAESGRCDLMKQLFEKGVMNYYEAVHSAITSRERGAVDLLLTRV